MKKNLALIVLSLFVFSAFSANAVQNSFLSRLGVDAKLGCPMLKPISQLYLLQHYNAKKFDLELEGRTIEQFIKHLDPSKSYLLESDVAEIRGMLRGIFNRLGEENCETIGKAHKIVTKRIQEAFEFAKKTLDDKYKFVDNVELILNPDLRKFAANKQESDDYMRKYIHFQISNYLASDTKIDQAKKMLLHRYELAVKRQGEFKEDELFGIFLDAYASSLDAHSSYLARDTLEDFNIQMGLSLEGIGAQLTWEDGYTVVENLIPGGSADRSGELKPKDKIIAVAQGSGTFEQVIDMPLRDVVKLIRGKKGTVVRLTVMRQAKDSTERLIIGMKRDKVDLKDEEAKLTVTTKKAGDKTYKIGVINLPSFYGDMQKKTRSCYFDMKKKVQEAARAKVDAIVLDLSKNGGGLLSEAVQIAGLFIKRGNIVATMSASQKRDELPDEDETIDYSGPLVILTSRLSASASEIVAGALQDYKRALIVGADHTFGKGSVQALMNLRPELGGGAIKVTTGMFFIPGGQSTQYRGVPADVALPSPFSTNEIGEVALEYSLKPNAISSFVSEDSNYESSPMHWKPVTPTIVKKLRELSAARVDKDPEFKKIKDELIELEKKKGVVKLADSLKKQKEDKKDPKKTAQKGRKRLKDEDYLKDPQVNEAMAIAADMVSLEGSQTASR